MLFITLFFLVPTVLSLSISITSPVVKGVDTPVSWSVTRSETDNAGFELYVDNVNGYDLKSVPISGRSGQSSIVFGSSWTPGSYNIVATWWDDDREVANAQIEVVEAPPTTATVTQTSTGVTTVTETSTQKTSTSSSDTHTQTPPPTSKATTSSTSTSVNTAQTSGSSTTSATTAGQSETPGPLSTNTSPDSSQTAAPNLTGAEVSQSKLPVILGVVLGAVILLLLIGFLVFWCRRHRRQIAASQVDPFTNVEGARSVAPPSLINVSTSNENNADLETRSIGSLVQVEHSSTAALISSPVSQAPFINPAPQTVLAEAARPPSLVKLGEKDLIDLDSHSPLQSLVMDPAVNHSAALAEIGRLRAELQRFEARESGVVARSSGITDVPPPSYDTSRSEQSLTSPV